MHWRIPLTNLAVTGVVATLLAVGAGESPVEDSMSQDSTSQGSTITAADLAPAAAATCTNLLVVGIDGNGEGRGATQGATVARIVTRIESQAVAQGRAVTVERVRLGTPKARVLLAKQRGPAVKAVTKKRLRRWAKPINRGVKATRTRVNAALAACPEQQVVLVGYAQGAAVAHRVAQGLSSSGRLANIASVVTVADPYRVRRSAAGRPLGSPAALSNSEGVWTRIARARADVPASSGTFGMVSVCHKHDLVCNPNRKSAKKALRTTTSYAFKGSREVMERAADRAFAQVSLWPVPATSQVNVEAGQPISVQIEVRGGSTTAPAAVFTPVSVPNGLALSSAGLLTGTVTAPGTHAVTYSLAGVNPPTTPHTATLLVRINAESGGRSAGGMSSCTINSDATAWCWGRNDFGQLGDGTTDLRTSAAQVLGEGWSKIATGGSFTCGVKADGTLWCWGLNNFGQLGGADKAPSAAPRQVGTDANWRDVSASWTHACATKTDGSLWCWGQNLHGQLGAGTMGPRSQGPLPVTGGLQFSQVSAGDWHTCGVTVAGDGYCWGNNAFGQVGDGTTTLRINPALVTGGHKFSQFATAYGRTCGVTTSGAALCWGENSRGELGNGTTTDTIVPTAVAGGHSFVQVALSLNATCGTLPDGQVLCWGDNRYGQLGPAATGSSSTPVAAGVSSVGSVVSAGWLHFCGGGACWGANDAGQMGNNEITPISMPLEPAPSWGEITRLTHKQVRNWRAARIARTALATRPGNSRVAVNGRNGRRSSFSFDVMTFNLLGSQHTAPSGGRPAFAPGRVRTEWARDIIERRGASIIGLSEPQPDQIDQLNIVTNGGYTIYPGNTQGYDAAPQSIMWKDSEWEFVWGNTAQMPFMRKSRPQAIVRLRHRASGREVYVINAHLSPGKMQGDRDKGMAIIVQLVKQLRSENLPILVTGDLNEHAKAFRKIACGTHLQAAIGGVSKGGCKPPQHMRVDWIFGGGGSFSETSIDVSPWVRRTTDHAVVSSRFSVQ